MREFIKNALNKFTATTKPTTDNRIVTRIIEQSTNRARKDINTWRSALTMAENKQFPNRIKLYDLYEDIILDNHVRNIQKRLQRMIAKRKLVVLKDKQVNEELTKLFTGKWFQNFVKYCVDSRLYGHSLIEFDFRDNKLHADLIPRKHVLPEVGGYKINPYDTHYTVYRNDPFYARYTIEVGDATDLGDLCAAAPNILFKKNSTIAWSEYTEVFGAPVRIGKTNSKSPADMNRMEGFMIGMAKNSYAVIDSQEEIDFVESTKGDAYKVYDMLIERMNSELSKLFLGETLTTDVGKNGSKAQSQVHQDVSDDVETDLQNWFINIVNEDLVPVLLNFGIRLEGFEIQYVSDNQTDLETDKWLEEKFEIDPQFFGDKYNVPILGVKTLPTNPDESTEPEDKKKELEEVKTGIENLLKNPIIKMHAEIDELYHHSHTH
jgi:Protein of unknown function (DUF935)